ncbi:Uncharacterised protein [Mycobacteroides abscessus subsp. abscessus]|nr:Uncharacterised protein [Mycobacteroides abscessus subsp. abscessus]
MDAALSTVSTREVTNRFYRRTRLALATHRADRTERAYQPEGWCGPGTRSCSSAAGVPGACQIRRVTGRPLPTMYVILGRCSVQVCWPRLGSWWVPLCWLRADVRQVRQIRPVRSLERSTACPVWTAPLTASRSAGTTHSRCIWTPTSGPASHQSSSRQSGRSSPVKQRAPEPITHISTSG